MKFYTVTLPQEDVPDYTVRAHTAQGACRTAFKFWIANGFLKKQPRTTEDGGFEGVEVEIRQ